MLIIRLLTSWPQKSAITSLRRTRPRHERQSGSGLTRSCQADMLVVLYPKKLAKRKTHLVTFASYLGGTDWRGLKSWSETLQNCQTNAVVLVVVGTILATSIRRPVPFSKVKLDRAVKNIAAIAGTCITSQCRFHIQWKIGLVAVLLLSGSDIFAFFKDNNSENT